MKILIAEDEPISRRMLEIQLIKWGHEVVCCNNGTEAWQALQAEGAPGLAILDWMMPDMDGVEVCKKVREELAEKPIYILMLTAKGQRNDVVAGLQAGADDYVTKPFEPEELQARIQVGMRVLSLQEQLLESTKLSTLTQTAGAAAHEINQPLTVIMGNAEIVMMLMEEDDPHRKYIEGIRKAGRRINDIVVNMKKVKQYVTKPYIRGEDIVDFDASGES